MSENRNHWQVTTLGKIAAEEYGLVDGPFGSNLSSAEYVQDGIPVIRGSNLTLGPGHFVDDEFAFVTQAKADELSRSNCYPGDIIFTKKGTLGQTGIIPQHHRYKRFVLSSNQMKLTVNTAIADPHFVYYYVSSPTSIEKIRRDAEATGVPKTNLVYLRTFPVPLPPLAEQRAIAAILAGFDDKIEANRRLNATLEATARALFQSWFVDFDPVRAKAEGRPPDGMDAATAALFPDSFVESPLGEIPRGWRVGTLGEIISERNERNRDSEFDRVLSAVSSGELVLSDEFFTKQVYSRDVSKYKRVYYLDFAYNPSRINIGSIGMLTDYESGVVSPVYVVFTPEAGYEWFVLYTIRLPQMKSEIDTLSSGTVRQNLRFTDMASIGVCIPPVGIVRCFNKLLVDFRAHIEANNRQSRTLAAARDALLPRLISGDVRVGVSQHG